MRQVTYLNRVVVRMRSTSRLISAVRTVQHRWRQKRRNRRNHFWSVHALVLQRAARRFLPSLAAAAAASRRVSSGSRGVTRLSPTELKLRRYVHRVRIMQAFVRGFQRISSGRMILLSSNGVGSRSVVSARPRRHQPPHLNQPNPAPNPNPYLNRRQVRDLVGTNHSASAHAVLQAEAASKPRRVSKAGAHLAASSKPAVGPDGAPATSTRACAQLLSVDVPHVPDRIGVGAARPARRDATPVPQRRDHGGRRCCSPPRTTRPSPATAGWRLTCIQQDLSSSRSRAKGPSPRLGRVPSVLSILDQLGKRPASMQPNPCRRIDASVATKGDDARPLKYGSARRRALETSKQVLEEILSPYPHPHRHPQPHRHPNPNPHPGTRGDPRLDPASPPQRFLAPEAELCAAFERAYEECRARETWQRRPIQGKHYETDGYQR